MSSKNIFFFNIHSKNRNAGKNSHTKQRALEKDVQKSGKTDVIVSSEIASKNTKKAPIKNGEA